MKWVEWNLFLSSALKYEAYTSINQGNIIILSNNNADNDINDNDKNDVTHSSQADNEERKRPPGLLDKYRD